MAANVRQRSRRDWPRGLREVRPGYFAWEPPADVRQFLDTPPPAGGFVLGRMTLPQAIAEVTEAYLHLHGKMQKKRLIHAVQGAPDRVSAWIPIYLERMGSRGVQQLQAIHVSNLFILINSLVLFLSGTKWAKTALYDLYKSMRYNAIAHGKIAFTTDPPYSQA